jgi:hypothetical protein
MSRVHHRHLRVLCEPDAEKPWVVQYCATSPHTWIDILRFRQCGEAGRYVDEITTRDRALLEADR